MKLEMLGCGDFQLLKLLEVIVNESLRDRIMGAQALPHGAHYLTEAKHFAPDCHDLFRGVGSTSFQHSDFIDRLSGHGTEISAFEKRR
jgi:hypothetical protein